MRQQILVFVDKVFKLLTKFAELSAYLMKPIILQVKNASAQKTSTKLIILAEDVQATPISMVVNVNLA
jgi:hypothetical protein